MHVYNLLNLCGGWPTVSGDQTDKKAPRTEHEADALKQQNFYRQQMEEFLLFFVYFVATVVWLSIMAYHFQKWERWDTVVDGLYFSWVTSTTIGFGDLGNKPYPAVQNEV